ncbi:hypothetical protein [Neobacillus sp. NPDC093127]|uniref:hypothetical protein n=1 Tax=Neobacillus sp. NPDC093127 TaxID=3364296 RepID=UPI003808529B
MFAVHFLEKKNVLLTQLLKRVPSVGEEVKIKGRKAKVSSVIEMDEKNIHVHVILETVKKTNVVIDNSKKKKR